MDAGLRRSELEWTDGGQAKSLCASLSSLINCTRGSDLEQVEYTLNEQLVVEKKTKCTESRAGAHSRLEAMKSGSARHRLNWR